MKVSLICTVFNEEGSIFGFLESYRNQTYYADEILIVDGGSTDGTQLICEQYAKNWPNLNISLIIDKTCNRQFCKGPIARGRNIGIINAKHQVIAVTDAGCLLEKNWMESICAPIAYGYDVSAGWYEPLINGRFSQDFAAAIMPRIDKVKPHTFLPSSRSIAFTRDAWEIAGRYPEYSYTGEDTLFDLCLKRNGLSIRFAPQAIVFWRCPRSYGEMLVKQYRYGYGDGVLGINRVSFLRNFASLLFPYWIVTRRLNIRQIFLRYVLITTNQVGYVFGVLGV